MAEEERQEPGTQESTRGRLGFDDLGMNVVAAPSTEEPSEVGRRAGGTWLVLIAVLVAAGIIAWLARSLTNLPPGEEAEARLRARLMAGPAWQTGTLQGAYYVAGNKLRVDFSTQISTADEKGRDQLRTVTVEVMKVLIEERPHRQLEIAGYQGEQQVVEARYRHKSALVGPGGERQLDIVVRVKGDPEGFAGAVSEAGARGLSE